MGFLNSFSACSVACLTLSVLSSTGVASAQSEPPPASPSSGAPAEPSDTTAPALEPAPAPSESAPALPPPPPTEPAPAPAPGITPAPSPSNTSVAPPPEPPPDDHSPLRIIAFGSNTRFSAGLPGGDVNKGSPLGNVAGVMFQVEGTLDAVLLERLVLGLRMGVGIATVDDWIARLCEADHASSCHVTTVNLGIHGEFLILGRRARFNPWLGLGLTHEVLMLGETVGSRDYGGYFSGGAWDFTAGFDFRPGKGPSLGPFVTYRTGKYTTVDSDDTNGVDQSAPIANPSGHHWLMLGVRSRF